MTFLEKIKPHLISNDLLIQETVLHALHDFPIVPEEWTNELLKEAFRNEEKQTSILIYIENQTFNEEAVKILLEKIPMMDTSNVHLAVNLLDHLEPELALKYKEPLEKYIREDMWSLYELIVKGTEEEVYTEYGKTLNDLENSNSFENDVYIKAKKLAAGIVKKGWVTEDEIEWILKDELKEKYFSFKGTLAIYMIGLLKSEKYIPLLSKLLVKDEDILLEEVSVALISFQSDEVVREVGPYLKNEKSIIYASSIIENIKSDQAVQVLREAYRSVEEIEDQDLVMEALCHQLSKEALPEISGHMEKEYFSSLVDIEQVAYSYYSIMGIKHPDMEEWRLGALGREMESEQGNMLQSVPIRNEIKVGRNDPCICGSGKKYKKCCGK